MDTALMLIEQREHEQQQYQWIFSPLFIWVLLDPVVDVIDDEPWDESMVPANNFPI